MIENLNINRSLYFYRLFKKFFDIFFSLFFLIFSLPLFLIISLFIKLSSRGPIFYLQERIGKNNIPFRCIKFRTMYPEAKDILENILMKDNNLKKEFEETHKLKNDPRITVIGKLLRKTSLDELPQFINVLRGEMSVVGPRPIVKEEKKKYGRNLKKVLSISPGITGLWQVSGRNNLTYKKRVMLDLNYVRNYNLLLDIRILIRTVGVILFPLDRGAY
ncbi:exopolysaccharide biosynthesis protein [Prochlorococcus marinus str. XMU1401]|uniref:Sugar transferase n=1 Tax=Prochlorococcus marinus str. XMU1401 TaxID=2052594 RepID=A0A8I2BGS6_PROMR|nr:sugar transferase [Prochlorococcus marinus]MBO8223262.1 sugar transferase [Prochlorococcus marinus str. XMU1401]MBW3059794.1 exopolysaccharide biosynthesis protein [Prochlorococcus marinus str. XMU1401E]MCQ9198980.1 sugar transferase [Prochlorococcus marinus XMU1429]PJC83610.1 exopolysaccharide biosynthesis protein [Prochlorococcus marinus str. XMU1401]